MKRLLPLLLLLCGARAAAQHDSRWQLHYADGRAVVMRDSLYGYVDRHGVEVIPCRYRKAYSFNNGMAIVRHDYSTFLIDTAGNRLDMRVEIPRFRGRAFDSFVTWVWQRIPFASDGEYAAARQYDADVIVTIDTLGRIAACTKAGDYPDALFEKVRDAVLSAPQWTPCRIDGRACAQSYLLPVPIDRLRPKRCLPVDERLLARKEEIVYPLFRGKYAQEFDTWFYEHIFFKKYADYLSATSGVVRAAFTVDEKGRVCDIEILDFHDDACRRKTIENLEKSPRWTPATLDGKPVAVRYRWSFRFKFRS